jgi:hypothetical protein
MDLNSYMAGSLLVLTSGAVAVLGLLVTRKIFDFERLRASHEVGGYLLTVVGTLYAVLLGLVVVDAMQQYQRAREVTEKEANNLVDVFILADQLPQRQCMDLRAKCDDYADQVINTEWQQMHGGGECPLSKDKAISLLKALLDFKPTTENERLLYPQMLQEGTQFWQNRHSRISIAEKGVPAIEWIVLIIGACTTIFFTYFFGLEDLRLQLIMTAMIAMLIALNLMLLLCFGYPFRGDLSVKTDAFRSVHEFFAEGLNPSPSSQ